MIKVFRPPVADKAELRKFGFVMAGAFVLLFGILGPVVKHHASPLWPWITGAVFLLCGLALPKSLAVVHRVWMTFGHYLGAFNSRVILSVVFFLIITPVAFVLKVTGRDPLNRRFSKEQRTYRDPKSTLSSMDKPF